MRPARRISTAAMTSLEEDFAGRLADAMTMSPAQAQALVRVIESSRQVRRRYQFFVWLQSQLPVLLPHQLFVCAAWQRQIRELQFDPFHSVPLAQGLLSRIGGAGQALQPLVQAWIAGDGRALEWSTSEHRRGPVAEACAPLHEAGLGHVAVHGMARPQRPAEIETFFVVAGPEPRAPEGLAERFELLLPHLHATFLRVQGTERQIGAPRPALAAPAAESRPGPITDREREILLWVREGKSNVEIASLLGISALTVKNHVQKILRKVGAANRAQAVAKAMEAQLLSGAPDGSRAPRSAGSRRNS
jgi:transcriptional regulator EpsA